MTQYEMNRAWLRGEITTAQHDKGLVAFADDIVGSYPEPGTGLVIQVHKDGHASYASLCADCYGTLRRVSATDVECTACGDTRRWPEGAA